MLWIPKFKPSIRVNNCSITIHPSDKQILTYNKFVKQYCTFNSQQFKKFLRYIACPLQRNTYITRVQQNDDWSVIINNCLNDHYLIVQPLCQNKYSYKGMGSWLLLANTNHCYLIDAIKSKDKIFQLQQIFQSQKIIKICYNLAQTMLFLKRDYSIFPINMFALQILEEGQQFNKQLIREKQQIIEILYEKPQTILERPLQDETFQHIYKLFKILLQYMTYMLPKVSVTSQQLILQKIVQRYKTINSEYQFLKYYQHQVQQALSQKDLNELTQKQRKLYQQLISFREHVGKMYDISPEVILPKDVIENILSNCRISVLQISELYHDRNYSRVGLQLCKRIYDVIQLHEQLYQDQIKLRTQVFDKELGKQGTKSFQPVNIKKLLKDIEWGDSSQWLNRKDDPSLKLYKEIISIDEFDYSIGEQYIKKMKGDVLKKKDIGKFLKYAQYMRNKNYDALKQLYQTTQKLQKQQKQRKQKKAQFNKDQSSFSQQTDFQGKQKESSPKYGRKLFTQQEMQIKSSTSLGQRINQKIQQNVSEYKIQSVPLQNQSMSQIHNIQQGDENTRSRKSSETSLMNIHQIDQNSVKRSDIKPLPKSIEQIYQMALQVKKNTDKKTNKKKQKKGKAEGTKQMDFIPTWNDIEKLINYAHSVK